MASKALEQPRRSCAGGSTRCRSVSPITKFVAAHYDPRMDDNPRFAERLTLLLFEWRERAWQNAEELRFIRGAARSGPRSSRRAEHGT
jgi:hypothetical protein